MKIYGLLFYLTVGCAVLTATGCSSKTAEAECNRLKKQAIEINSRAPSAIDSVTTLVGVSVTYSDGVCDVHVTNAINELAFIKLVVLANLEMNPAQLDLIQIDNLLTYLNSEEGQEFYRGQLLRTLAENPLIKSSHKDIKTTYVYVFDLGNIKPLKVTMVN